MLSHEIDYKIYGSDLQAVEVTLDPGETIIAEAGAMCWMDSEIEFKAKLGDGSPARSIIGHLFKAGKRLIAGESVLLTHFTNKGDTQRRVAFAAPTPGKIVPIDLSKTNRKIYCQRDAFLCAAYGTQIDIAFTKRLSAGFFGGEGFVLEKLVGDGIVFLQAGGALIKKELHNTSIYVDTGCLVAFSSGIDYSISTVKNISSALFGGEGLFLAKLSGTGVVILQTMPVSKLAATLTDKIALKS